MNLKISKKKKDEFKDFFQLYISTLQRKQLSFQYDFLTQKLLILIKYLAKINFISGYKIFNMKSKQIKIFLRYERIKKTTRLPKIIFFSSRQKKLFISSKTLKKLGQYHPHSFLLIGTKYGLTNFENSKILTCGGELILAIL